MLDNGNILYHDDWNVVKEIKLDGTEVWRYESSNVHAFTRMKNGNTMIAESGKDRIIVVDKAGKIISETPLGKDGRGKTRQAEVLENGNYLVCAERPGTVQQQARTAVFRADDADGPSLDEAMPDDGRSRGERALLLSAGADQADEGIRQIVNRETQSVNAESKDFIDTLVFWRDEEPTGEIVDADAEARRLSENAALGKSPVEGTTPTIERRKKALLEGIF